MSSSVSSGSAAGKDGESVTSSSGGAVRGADGRDGRTVVVNSGSGAADGGHGGSYSEPAETRTEVLTDELASIVISTEAGSIKVAGADTDQVSITRRIFRTPTDPRESVTMDGDVLRIESGCPVQTGPMPCRIDYELEVPPTTRVELTTASGAVELTALDGVQTAISASGDIAITGAGGGSEVTARSVSGTLRLDEHGAPVTKVASTSGDVEVRAVARPELIEVNSTSGSIAISVPAGGYRLETSTMTGRKDVSVQSDQGAGALIRTRTITGNVRVTS